MAKSAQAAKAARSPNEIGTAATVALGFGRESRLGSEGSS